MTIRKASSGRQKKWIKDQVLAGLLRFYEDFGRFPMIRECDNYKYLPSGRSIQRNFGGLIELRKELGIKEEYHCGENRKRLCTIINKRGSEREDKLYRQLIDIFGDVCVHREKSAPGCKERLDFVIYYRGGRIGVDVFFARDRYNLKTIIQMKNNKYKTFEENLYFVCSNPDITDVDIERVVANKKIPYRKIL